RGRRPQSERALLRALLPGDVVLERGLRPTPAAGARAYDCGDAHQKAHLQRQVARETLCHLDQPRLHERLSTALEEAADDPALLDLARRDDLLGELGVEHRGFR